MAITKNNLTGHDGLTTVSNYISQINAGGTVYDIATHHGITFKSGTNELAWNGITDITVEIPTVADLAATPINFVGTVGSDGNISYNEDISRTSSIAGDLVFITANCTFDNKACEAGDMAVYDGSNWQIVTGENQVTINGIDANNDKVFSLTGTAQSVLTVEGKTLSLNIDYADVRSHMAVAKNAVDVTVTGNVSVGGFYVGLSKADDDTLNITKTESFALPTKLADGTVTVNGAILSKGDFTFDAGALATPSMNASAIALTTTSEQSLVSNSAADGWFVSNISGSIVSSVDISVGSDIDGKSFVSSVSTSAGSQSFVSKVHTKTDADTGTADFAVYTYGVDASHKTFVSGFGAAAASGEVISSVVVTGASLVEGTGILTGIEANDNGDIITGVNFGGVALNGSAWFVSGLVGDGSEVVTDVTAISKVELVSDDASTFASSAMISAVVSDHVLSFTSANFMKPVAVSTTGAVVSKTGFTKGGVQLDGNQSVSKANFTQSGLDAISVAVSYKSLLTNDVALTSASTEYFFDKKAETIPTWSDSKIALNKTFATIAKGTPSLTGSTAVQIPTGTVVTAFASAGVLPTFSIADATTSLTASVGTALTSSTYSFTGVDSSKANAIPVAGAYTLVSAADSVTGYIEVAEASTYSLASGKAAVAANTFVTDVYVSGTAVTVSSSTPN